MSNRGRLIRLTLALAYGLAMFMVAAAHRPLAVTPIERALILAEYRLPGDVPNDFCLPGLGEPSRLDTPCDACVLAAAPGLGAATAPTLELPPAAVHAVTLPGDIAEAATPARQRPHPRGPPLAA
jgi:hypothetical protein